MTKNRAAIELVFAGVLWGFAFVAAIWALTAFTAVETMVWRFFIATVIGELMYWSFFRLRDHKAWSDFKLAIPGGLILGSMLLAQTVGLQYTSATKSGFITSLYVILVPLLNTFFFKSPSNSRSFFLVGVALIGTALLVNVNLNDLNPGDLWTLLCALFAAFHIIYIGKISQKITSPFRFNNFQSFWCLLLSLPFLFAQPKITLWTPHALPWVGLLILGIAASVIAFFVQIRSQKVLSDMTASMLFLLESPFAALFGFFILHESLRPFQIAGAVLIMTASSLQILWTSSSETIETTSR